MSFVIGNVMIMIGRKNMLGILQINLNGLSAFHGRIRRLDNISKFFLEKLFVLCLIGI